LNRAGHPADAAADNQCLFQVNHSFRPIVSLSLGFTLEPKREPSKLIVVMPLIRGIDRALVVIPSRFRHVGRARAASCIWHVSRQGNGFFGGRETGSCRCAAAPEIAA
jgi:hypothetical protein